MEKLLRSELRNRPRLWFQQDEATAHTTRETMALLRDIFYERIISHNSHSNWLHIHRI